MYFLDYLILAIYLIAMLAIGFYFSRIETKKEFFVAGGTMGWLAVGLSVMATLFSSNSFVFYTSASFGDSLRIGISLIAFSLMTPIVMFVFIPVFSRTSAETAYEYLEQRFSLRLRLLASGLFILLRIGWMASATFSASLVVSKVTGISIVYVILGMGLVTIFYTMFGGMKAVMWTDVLQFFVFTIAIVVTLGIVFWKTEMAPGDIWSFYTTQRKDVFVNWDLSLTLKYGTWALLIGSFIEAVSAFGVDQVAVQRYLSAKSERTSKIGALLNLAGMWIVIPSLLLVGVCLFAYYSQHTGELGNGTVAELLKEDPKLADRAMPTFVRTHFPPGLIGLFIAALLAAIMSSIDSGIHSVTTAIIIDFRDTLFPKWKPKDESKDVNLIRLLLLSVGTVAVVLACFVDGLGTVFELSRKLTSAFGGPLLAIFVLALFTRRANWQGVFVGVLIAPCATFALMYWQTNWFAPWFWPIGFSIALVLGYLFSLFFATKKTELTYLDIIRKQKRVPDEVS